MDSQFQTEAAWVRSGPDERILGEVRQRGCHLAVWERPRLGSCAQAVAGLLLADGPVRWDSPIMSTGYWQEELNAKLGGSVPHFSCEALAGDISRLAEIFCRVADVGHPRIRLERVEDDGCRLFHSDTLHYRMLCIYAGGGTEWLTRDNVRMDELGLRGRDLDAANRAIVIDESAIRTLPSWHVALFSGKLRGDTPPLVHRSAPVGDASEHRLRLCIDMPSGCDC